MPLPLPLAVAVEPPDVVPSFDVVVPVTVVDVVDVVVVVDAAPLPAWAKAPGAPHRAVVAVASTRTPARAGTRPGRAP